MWKRWPAWKPGGRAYGLVLWALGRTCAGWLHRTDQYGLVLHQEAYGTEPLSSGAM